MHVILVMKNVVVLKVWGLERRFSKKMVVELR
jgi:hypothetical protein